jgi:hypothetical protein
MIDVTMEKALTKRFMEGMMREREERKNKRMQGLSDAFLKIKRLAAAQIGNGSYQDPIKIKMDESQHGGEFCKAKYRFYMEYWDLREKWRDRR